jgi:D-threo-aldose 1-dehydrogenase
MDRLPIPPFGLGCAQLGNLYRAISDETAADTVDTAWARGVRYFDTAPHYGLGLSERRLGAALRARPRDAYVLSTKVGRLLVPTTPASGRDDQGFDVPATHHRVWDFSRDGVLRSLESSLERLGLDRVDVLFLHDPDDHWRQAIDEGYPALAELRDQGVVDAIGVGMNEPDMPARFVRHTDVDLIMLAGRYTLLEQGALDLLALCEQRDVRLVAAGVFNSGLLATDRPRADATYDYGPVPADLLDRARRIAEVCQRHGSSVPAAALQFPLAHPAVASVVVGSGTAEQVHRNVDLMNATTPAAMWMELAESGLLDPAAPIPPRPGSAGSPQEEAQ